MIQPYKLTGNLDILVRQPDHFSFFFYILIQFPVKGMAGERRGVAQDDELHAGYEKIRWIEAPAKIFVRLKHLNML